MDIHRIYSFFQRRFRRKRMKEFVSIFGITTNIPRVLDVGGTLFNWTLIDIQLRLTILNVTSPPNNFPDNVEWIVGDARAMPFPDKNFDVVFSNSVIEHVGG